MLDQGALMDGSAALLHDDNIGYDGTATLIAHPRVMSLLKWTANYRPPSLGQLSDLTHASMYFLAWVPLLVLTTTYAVTMAIWPTTLNYAFGVTVILAITSVFPSLVTNRDLLHRPLVPEEQRAVDKALTATYRFALWRAVTALVSAIMFAVDAHYKEVVNGEFTILMLRTIVLNVLLSMYLTFNLFMLLLNTISASRSVEDLIYLASQGRLSSTTYKLSKHSTEARVHYSCWCTDTIIAPCICSVVTIVLATFYSTNLGGRLYVAAWCVLLLKELMFLFMAFWYASEVNEKSDNLTRQVCADDWTSCASLQFAATQNNCTEGLSEEGNHTNGSNSCKAFAASLHLHSAVKQPNSTVTNGDVNQPADILTDNYLSNVEAGIAERRTETFGENQRMALCIACLSRPISYKLLGRRVSRENVAWSVLGFVVSMVVGIVRGLIMHV